jgi:hypothetical protein
VAERPGGGPGFEAARVRLQAGVERHSLEEIVETGVARGCAFAAVLAAPHSRLRVADDQTARLLAVLRIPGVHILAHPRGRMYSSRPGITADWPVVFAEAAAWSYAETAVAHARLAGVPPDRVINCWPLSRLVEWLSARAP